MYNLYEFKTADNKCKGWITSQIIKKLVRRESPWVYFKLRRVRFIVAVCNRGVEER